MRRSLSVGAQIGLGLAASVGLGWLALRGLDWSLVRGQFESLSVPLVVAGLLIFIFASWLRAWRWKLLFFDEEISVGRLFIVQNEGIGLNNLVPLRVASEPVQLAVLVLRDRVDGAKALATLGMERVLDVFVSTAVLGAALLLVPEMARFKPYIWGAIGFAVLAVLLVLMLAWGGPFLAPLRRLRFLSAFAAAVRELVSQRVRLTASLLLTAIYWALVGVTAWMVALAVDLDISLVTATLVIMGTIFFATAVPSAPSAIGTFEFAVVYVLEFFGVEREAGFGAAVLTHAVFFLPPTIIAAVFLPREGVGSMRRLLGLIGRGGRTDGG